MQKTDWNILFLYLQCVYIMVIGDGLIWSGLVWTEMVCSAFVWSNLSSLVWCCLVWEKDFTNCFDHLDVVKKHFLVY